MCSLRQCYKPTRSTRAAGSLVLRRMDRRGLVWAKKHGTKSGSGAPLRRGFSFGGWYLNLHSERIEKFPRDVLFFLEAKEGLIWQNPNQGSN